MRSDVAIAVDRATVGYRLVEAFRRGRSQNTLQAYAIDLENFARFCESPSPADAISMLVHLSPGAGNALLLSYLDRMMAAELAPATINRRMSAVRSIIALARQLGITDWQPEVRGLKTTALRDTRGPGLDGTKALLEAARDQAPVKAARDVAIVRVLFDMALRRGELASLDLEHVDLPGKRLHVLGKGHRERTPMTMPTETAEAVEAWLAARATVCLRHDKPVFVALAGPRFSRRISGRGIWHIITELAGTAGIRAAPHGLRHASITAVLDATGDLRAAQRHGRHASATTTLRYDDNRQDIAGKAAQTVASLLSDV